MSLSEALISPSAPPPIYNDSHDIHMVPPLETEHPALAAQHPPEDEEMEDLFGEETEAYVQKQERHALRLLHPIYSGR
jgi:hypothetical protein